MKPSTSISALIRQLCLLGAISAGLTACAGGPERAPHQPIQGVDTEKTEVENPHDTKAPGRDGDISASLRTSNHVSPAGHS